MTEQVVTEQVVTELINRETNRETSAVYSRSLTLEERRAWWTDRRVAVWGAARTGVAAARLLAKLGARVTLSDSRPASALKELESLPDAVHLELGRPNALGDAEVLIPSPGLRPSHPLMVEALESEVHVMSEVELGASVTAAELIAVTGTDGKSTTTLLINEALRAHGLWARAVGNIGDPISNWALEAPAGGYFALEVSAFQLWSTQSLGVTRVGVITNIAEDHHDYFDGSAERYRDAKLKLASLIAPGGTLLYPPSALALPQLITGDLQRYIASHHMSLTPYSHPHHPIESPLLGAHNQLNLSAALGALDALNLSHQPALQRFLSFSPLPYRLTLTRELRGVRYINDSKATNVHAACVGLASLEVPERSARDLIVICGGYDKGLDLAPFIERLIERARLVLTIGQTGPAIERALLNRALSSLEVIACGELERAIELAARHARSGERVVLSPAASSFDQFESYEARGARFDSLVSSLV